MYLLYYYEFDNIVNAGVCDNFDEAIRISADYYDTRKITLKMSWIDKIKGKDKRCDRVVTVYSALNGNKFSYYTEHYTRRFEYVEYPIVVAGCVQFVFNFIANDISDRTIENTANRFFKVMAERYVSGFYGNVR